jgi:hypothetical protein
MSKSKTAALVHIAHIAQSIFVLRGHKVLLDSNLAALYGVTTKRFNEQVKRNLARFPEDFMLHSNDGRGRPSLRTLCFHRTGRRHAFQRH